MKGKCLVVFGCSLLLALATAGSAWADACPPGGTFPAQNVGNCEGIGGVFTQVGDLRTCVVNAQPTRVACLHSSGFSADVSGSTTTYTRNGNDCTTNTENEGVILACYNSQGQAVSVNACADKNCIPPQ